MHAFSETSPTKAKSNYDNQFKRKSWHAWSQTKRIGEIKWKLFTSRTHSLERWGSRERTFIAMTLKLLHRKYQWNFSNVYRRGWGVQECTYITIISAPAESNSSNCIIMTIAHAASVSALTYRPTLFCFYLQSYLVIALDIALLWNNWSEMQYKTHVEYLLKKKCQPNYYRAVPWLCSTLKHPI